MSSLPGLSIAIHPRSYSRLATPSSIWMDQTASFTSLPLFWVQTSLQAAANFSKNIPPPARESERLKQRETSHLLCTQCQNLCSLICAFLSRGFLQVMPSPHHIFRGLESSNRGQTSVDKHLWTVLDLGRRMQEGLINSRNSAVISCDVAINNSRSDVYAINRTKQRLPIINCPIIFALLERYWHPTRRISASLSLFIIDWPMAGLHRDCGSIEKQGPKRGRVFDFWGVFPLHQRRYDENEDHDLAS